MKAEIVMYAVLTLLKVCVIEYLLFLQLTQRFHDGQEAAVGMWFVHQELLGWKMEHS